MKKAKLLTAVLLAVLALSASAQDRKDTAPAMLSAKSLPISKATYWSKDTKTGKWESRKNTSRPYMGEGVHIDNFNDIFIGEYAGHSYLFLDYLQGEWRYPNLKTDWWYYRYIYMGLLSEEDLAALKNLKQGESFTFMPKFYNRMFKGHAEYSPAMLLTTAELLRSTDYKTDPIFLFAVKRTMSQGQDVVRFLVYPHALAELLDSFYFEVTYDYYMRLFTPDKSVKFK